MNEMDELFGVFLFVYILLLSFFLFVFLRRYRAKGVGTGVVLLRLKPAGRRYLSIAYCVVLLAVIAILVLVALNRLPPDSWRRWRLLQFGFYAVFSVLVTVFSALPVRICENGLVDSAGFLPWDIVASYEKKRPGRVNLRLKEVCPGHIFRTVWLDCPAAFDEALGAVLRERVG